MRRWMPVFLTVALCWGFTAGSGSGRQDQAPRTVMQKTMRQKLTYMQGLMEEVLLGRHAKVAELAQEISLLTQDPAWQVVQTQEFLERTTVFRRTAGQLADQARKKKWEAEALNYLALTQQCIQCHQSIRGAEEG